MNGYEELVGF